ncbi:hypothetical protein Y032_0576g205 [Ancylostoma ceylanicum]|uniref:Centrosomal protein CEP104 Zn finger domain-containing protein n=1 Tax=Ancylostoma ceylanicum TaxID=53326 RepID=A0A016WQC0_9BILA|nr:hypothetical protein Y032_0576g205 [Ancylostoma ceylanicum]
MTEEAVTIFGVNCLRHTDPEIRTIGRKLILDVYSNGKREVVRKILIEENRKSKSPSLRSLLDEIADLDAKQARQQTSSSLSGSQKKRPGTKSVRISNDLPKRNGSMQSSCRFCGIALDPIDAAAVERHYHTNCPMFTKCGGCGQVAAVSSLETHKRTECRAQNNYRACSRCGELIDRRLFHRHIARKDCKPPEPYSAKCPLCGSNVTPDNDDGWRKHLTAQCGENPRRRAYQETRRSSLSPASLSAEL